MQFTSKVKARPLIRLESVRFLSLKGSFLQNFWDLAIIHINKYRETTYHIIISQVFWNVYLGKIINTYRENTYSIIIHLVICIFGNWLDRDHLFDYNPYRYWLFRTWWNSIQRLERDILFNYNPSSYLHSSKLVRPRPLIQLQSVSLLAILDLVKFNSKG